MSRKGKKKPPERRREEKAASPRADARKVPSAALGSGDGGEDAPASSLGRKDWLFAAALLAAVFLVYQPAWRGGLIWDDTEHVTRPELRDWHGLYRIWFDVRATVQYYPLLHSAFWLQHKLWGDATLGYHLVNIFLHATAALMVALILRRLAIPGAWLAAAIFALHPVQVESVAWITELKNTLSAVLYLGAALAYLRFDRSRHVGQVSNLSKEQAGNLFQRQVGNLSYVAALGLFVAALLSKTVTATLPGALLVIFWWQRGRLSWKNDVLPLLPFFLLGAGMATITAWWELEVNECVGPEFDFTRVERFLIAGRAVWFHLGKLFWPANLTFIYPRWQINAGAWWQYLFPLGCVVFFAMTWAIRHRTRAPLAAVLFFGGTLLPVLGFFNLYTFQYSLVADHYQYLASLGIITLLSAGAVVLLKRFARMYPARGTRLRVVCRYPRHTECAGYISVFGRMGCVALVALLAILSWRQSGMYTDVETLYRTTIDRNPDCWMAHHNLGVTLAGRGQVEEAIIEYQKALEIKPDYAPTHHNLGTILAGRGQFDKAIAQYAKALQIKPDDAEAHNNLGVALAGRGQFDKAIAQYAKALQIKPDDAEAHNNLGFALAGLGRVKEAIAEYETALQIKPDDAEAHNNLGFALAGRGQMDQAIAQYEKALQIKPGYAEAHNNLGFALAGCRQVEKAIAEYQKALEIKPDCWLAHHNLGNVLAGRKQVAEAMAQYEKALEIKPDHAPTHNNLGNILASLGRFDEAVAHYRKALEIKPDYTEAHGNLGSALAAQGKLDEAIRHYLVVLRLNPQDVLAHKQLGDALTRQGRLQEAEIHFRKAGTPLHELRQPSPAKTSAEPEHAMSKDKGVTQ